MTRFSAARLLVVLLLASSTLSASGAVGAEKPRYTLLNPTPTAEMREFSPDRPDRTEGPYTVDPGHIQIEADLVAYTHDKVIATDTTTQDSLSFAFVNFKFGLLSELDFELIQEIFHRALTDVNGEKLTATGMGDTTLRLKFNFLGNDGAPIAMGLIPFVKFPTNSGGVGNKTVEGGLILPVSLSMPHELNLGFMMELNQALNTADSQLHTEFISSASLSREIGLGFEGYVEFFSKTSNEPGSAWTATADVGLIYSIAKDLKVDIGMNAGVTDAADDMNLFVGVAKRF